MNYDNNKFQSIAKQLDEIFRNIDNYRSVFEIERLQAETEINLYSELKEKAALGDKSARDFIINQFTRILSTRIFDLDESALTEFMDFDDLQNNHVQLLFEMILQTYDISFIIDKYEIDVLITEETIRNIAREEEKHVIEYFDSHIVKLKLIATLAYARQYGQDCIDTLQYNNINEIGIANRNYIYIVYRGRKIYLSFLKFKDNNVILNIQKKTTQNSSINYDEQNPALVSSKLNSSRITVAGFSATPTDDDLYYNERIFNLKKITLEQMKNEYATIDDLVYDFLVMNQNGRGSHFITGADMGVGKSTFLLAMMGKVPDRWGIGILDTQNELQAGRKYPRKNIKTLIQNNKRSISECFIIMLKMARDVICVGEITMPAEVAELINASLRLNAGVGATMHSLSPFEVVTNVRNLLMRTDMYSDSSVAETDIAKGLDIVVHLAKLPGGRIVVERVVEIVFEEQDKYPNMVFEGNNREKISNILDMLQMALGRYLYRKNYRYNEVFRFDMEKDIWIPVNLPHKGYFDKISKYVSSVESNTFCNKFLNRKKELSFSEVPV